MCLQLLATCVPHQTWRCFRGLGFQTPRSNRAHHHNDWLLISHWGPRLPAPNKTTDNLLLAYVLLLVLSGLLAPHVVLKAGGWGGFEFWGLGPQTSRSNCPNPHTAHSTQHTTQHTTTTPHHTQPQHHNTTTHTTTKPQHTTHNTTHSTQHTSTRQHKHTAHTQHRRRRRKRRSGQTLNPGHRPKNWQEGTTTHTHSTQHNTKSTTQHHTQLMPVWAPHG